MFRRKTIALFFLLVFLLGQGAAIARETHHAMHGMDQNCEVCDTAHYVPHGPVPNGPRLAVPMPDLFSRTFVTASPDQTITPVYSSRAPPLG